MRVWIPSPSWMKSEGRKTLRIENEWGRFNPTPFKLDGVEHTRPCQYTSKTRVCVDPTLSASIHVENKWGAPLPRWYRSKMTGRGWTHPVCIKTCRKQMGRSHTLPVCIELERKRMGGGQSLLSALNRNENGWEGINPSPCASNCIENRRGGVKPSPCASNRVENRWGGVKPSSKRVRRVGPSCKGYCGRAGCRAERGTSRGSKEN